jgi:hypothetical protein
MLKLLLSVLLSVVLFSAAAQSWEVGGFAGGSGYMGDLNPVKTYKLNKAAYGGQVKRNVAGYFALELSMTRGEIFANDAASDNSYFQQRNLSFFTSLTEISLQTEFNFFQYIPSISQKVYTPYIFTGISDVFFNPKTTFNGNTYELSLYRTEGQALLNPYKTEALAIPYGAGIKYNIAGKWSVVGEIGYRTAFTDFLDDVSGVYPSKALLTDPTRNALSDRSGENTGIYTGTPGSQRGDMRKRDTYMFAGLSLTYTFITPRCYEFR